MTPSALAGVRPRSISLARTESADSPWPSSPAANSTSSWVIFRRPLIGGGIGRVSTGGNGLVDAKYTSRAAGVGPIPGNRSQDAVLGERLGGAHPLGQRLADEVLAAHLLLGQPEYLFRDPQRDDHDPVVVGEHQVIRVDQHPAATD